MLPFKRDLRADRINRVVNDPSVFPDVALAGQESLDLTPVVKNLANIVLMTDEGGIVAHWQEPGLYEIHTQFTERYRGVSAVRTVREMLSWLFLRSEAVELLTKIPRNNERALGLVRAIGGKFEFGRENAHAALDGEIVGVDYYSLGINDWKYSAWASPGLMASGAAFHQQLEERKRAMLWTGEAHGEDPAHDINVGATVQMIFAGLPEKALHLYNRWARFAGYAEARMLSRSPLVIDIADSVLHVDIEKRDFEVLEIRPKVRLAASEDIQCQ